MLLAIQVNSEAMQDNYVSLHTIRCQGSVDDVQTMEEKLRQDPEALHRICMPMLTTPLHHAASAGHDLCVRFMLRQGASTNIEDRTGCTPLEAAVSRTRVDCVGELLAHGADPNFKSPINFNQSRSRCLARACLEGNSSIVSMLLEAGALVDDIPFGVPDYLLISPCSFAVAYGHPEILRLLLLHGAVTDLSHLPNCQNNDQLVKKHLLPHLAITHMGRNGLEATKRCLEILRQFGADFSAIDQNGKSPQELAHILKSSKNVEEYEALIENFLDKCSSPLSLLELARLTLFRHCKANYFHMIPKLNIPRCLVSYLYYKNEV
ncbi:ankyrin repeat, PH and SEC7 domain containing protein secG-like [Cloeon dipterum]|uniref:ankyrin repeat, PH and SEC7 domain containing protein secG-like n=1 Tax=Cloeon dipterum TaxID=197152 RepID=UPI00322035B7